MSTRLNDMAQELVEAVPGSPAEQDAIRTLAAAFVTAPSSERQELITSDAIPGFRLAEDTEDAVTVVRPS